MPPTFRDRYYEDSHAKGLRRYSRCAARARELAVDDPESCQLIFHFHVAPMLERVEAWTRVASVILGNRCFPGTMASLLKRAYQGRKRALNDAPWIVDEMRRYYLAFPEGSVQELST